MSGAGASLGAQANRSPANRPPEDPFYPDALPYWVLEDNHGNKSLVKEMVTGCRHWRIGDPNVDFCVECLENGQAELLGCYTCKRSYHESCLGAALASFVYNERFYCPECTRRGWNVNPPRNILPLISTGGGAQDNSTMEDRSAQKVLTELDNIPKPPPTATHPAIYTPGLEIDAPPPVPVTSPHGADRQPRSVKRRSRYQTIPDDVDQAMSTIYRELESVAELKAENQALQQRLAVLEQERQMQRGQFALAREEIGKQARAESEMLRRELENVKAGQITIIQENERLKQELQQVKSDAEARSKELHDMKTTLRQWLDK